MSSITLYSADPAASNEGKAILYPRQGGLLTELTLVDAKGTPRPLLWSAPAGHDSGYPLWPGYGAPFLFPFAGRQWHGEHVFQYELAGYSFAMPLHGFAYQQPWTITSHQRHHACLQLQSSEQTAAFYPFDFTLTLRYTLQRNCLRLDIDIVHHRPLAPLSTDQAMPLAPGWHPFFLLNQLKTKASQQSLHLPRALLRQVTAEGRAAPIHLTDTQSAALPYTFTIDEPTLRSCIFANCQWPIQWKLDAVSTLTINASPQFHNLVTFGGVERGYMCLEPWFGLPDCLNQRQGLAWLQPGQKLSAWCEVSLS